MAFAVHIFDGGSKLEPSFDLSIGTQKLLQV
jgi:hypothetical protein